MGKDAPYSTNPGHCRGSIERRQNTFKLDKEAEGQQKNGGESGTRYCFQMTTMRTYLVHVSLLTDFTRVQ
jgi:hypothetical protein